MLRGAMAYFAREQPPQYQQQPTIQHQQQHQHQHQQQQQHQHQHQHQYQNKHQQQPNSNFDSQPETTATATATATATYIMALECWRWFASWCPCWAAAAAAPLDPRAAKAARDADKSLEAAQGAVPARAGKRALGHARRLLARGCAKSAARALMGIGRVAADCDESALRAVQAAERAMRDVVVLRLCAPREVGHDAFIQAAEVAFSRRFRGGFLSREDRELRACLLLAYHKLRARD